MSRVAGHRTDPTRLQILHALCYVDQRMHGDVLCAGARALEKRSGVGGGGVGGDSTHGGGLGREAELTQRHRLYQLVAVCCIHRLRRCLHRAFESGSEG